jgi:Dolichyl-phosphate-mannose-protein mannosyltransferase
MSAVVALALAGCALGLVAVPAAPHDTAEQALDLVRLLCTLALALSLLLGPGIAWRALGSRDRPLSLGFLPLPGLVLMIGGGGLAWALANSIGPRPVCFALFVPVLVFLLGTLLLTGSRELFTREERRILLVLGCVLGLAISRSLWSLGPEGELYAGTISRTLEVGDRSDSRISFHVVQLIAKGEGPYGRLASTLLHPYNFSSRGPLPGLAASPVVLLAGGRPPAVRPDQPWLPFDPQGFMAYRLAMMAFAAIAFLALWDLVRRIAGRRAAYLAVLLAATTPFLVHEVWFTWPKLLASAMVLLGAIWVIQRRPLRAGLLSGFGYLMHPGVLLAVPTLGLIALWPLRGARWKRPRIRQGLLLAAGVAFFLIAWRLVNGRHYDQSGFLDYFVRTGPHGAPGFGTAWLVSRLESLGNTLVPLLLPLADAHNASINVVRGSSPPIIHFFFQYWNTVPFGFGIIFLPLLVVGLWRAGRRWPWPVAASVILPFALFTVYWGSFTSGIMREGLQAWALTLCAVIACEQAASGFGWLRSRPIRAVLALRVVEVLAVALVPTVATRGGLISPSFPLTDAVAVAAMLGFGAALGALVWKAIPSSSDTVRDRGVRQSELAT